jgi:hypothetical protein
LRDFLERLLCLELLLECLLLHCELWTEFFEWKLLLGFKVGFLYLFLGATGSGVLSSGLEILILTISSLLSGCS